MQRQAAKYEEGSTQRAVCCESMSMGEVKDSPADTGKGGPSHYSALCG
jgi:hypothetical protein